MKITEKDYDFLISFFEKYKKIESIRRFVSENSYFEFNDKDVEETIINAMLSIVKDENLLYMTKKQYENYTMFHLIDNGIKNDYILREKIISMKVISGYLCIDIREFKEGISDVLILELSKFKMNYFKGIIIDLRGNKGGIIEEAIRIAKVLLNHSVITIIAQKNNIRKYIYSEKNCFDISIFLLIDEKTGSASELLSAALIDNERAIAIGGKTYGKGTIQEVVKLNDGSGLKLTVAEFLSPVGNTIEKIGIKPTYEFEAKNIEEYIEFIDKKIL